MKRVRWFVVFALALAVLALPSIAWAAPRAADCPYPGTNCPPTNVLPETQSSQPSSQVLGNNASNSSLPFTGGDVLGLTAIGAGAVVVGVVLARRGRNARARS